MDLTSFQGGTSTDVSRYGGQYEHVFESVTAGVHINCAQLDINTVAAGGGSMLFWRNGLFVVGPESVSLSSLFTKRGPNIGREADLECIGKCTSGTSVLP